MDKKASRIRRARRARAKISELGEYRLSVHRTPLHIYAQVIAPNGAEVVASASTVDKTAMAQIEGSAYGDIFLSANATSYEFQITAQPFVNFNWYLVIEVDFTDPMNLVAGQTIQAVDLNASIAYPASYILVPLLNILYPFVWVINMLA